jgi:hypothetical protein
MVDKRRLHVTGVKWDFSHDRTYPGEPFVLSCERVTLIQTHAGSY